MRFDTFCKTVNRIAAQNVKDANSRKGNQLFIGHHVDYPTDMLRLYYEKGMAPNLAAYEIAGNNGV